MNISRLSVDENWFTQSAGMKKRRNHKKWLLMTDIITVITYIINFHPLEVVGCGSYAQLQADEKSDI